MPKLKKVSQTMVCKKHGKFQSIGSKLFSGKIIWSQCPFCQQEYETEKKKSEKANLIAQKQAFINSLKHKSDIPQRYAKIKLEDFESQGEKSLKVFGIIKSYCNKFNTLKNSGSSMIFCGKPGTGKTHLACAIGNELIESGESVKYITAYKAVSAVKHTYSKTSDKTEKEVFADFQEPGLLIIDELGVQFGSDAEKIIFYHIINNRYENILPTILISNLDKHELKDFIGARVVDRLKEGDGSMLVFDWDSYRPKNKNLKFKTKHLSAWEKFIANSNC